VFSLAVPLLGFGVLPTVVALTLYGVLPVLQNTIAGMEALPDEVLESASGMGLGRRERLRRIEFPLAAPIILAGIRVSVVINVATATIGAVAGAGGLGAPIISGLVLSDPAVTLQGAVLTACLALIIDAYLGAFESAAARSVGIKEA
jgi:osmoprotectant transport system permease protein